LVGDRKDLLEGLNRPPRQLLAILHLNKITDGGGSGPVLAADKINRDWAFTLVDEPTDGSEILERVGLEEHSSFRRGPATLKEVIDTCLMLIIQKDANRLRHRGSFVLHRRTAV